MRYATKFRISSLQPNGAEHSERTCHSATSHELLGFTDRLPPHAFFLPTASSCPCYYYIDVDDLRTDAEPSLLWQVTVKAVKEVKEGEEGEEGCAEDESGA